MINVFFCRWVINVESAVCISTVSLSKWLYYTVFLKITCFFTVCIVFFRKRFFSKQKTRLQIYKMNHDFKDFQNLNFAKKTILRSQIFKYIFWEFSFNLILRIYTNFASSQLSSKYNINKHIPGSRYCGLLSVISLFFC